MAECIRLDDFMPLKVQKYANPLWPNLCSVGLHLCIIFAGGTGKLLQWRSDYRLWVFFTGLGDGEAPAT